MGRFKIKCPEGEQKISRQLQKAHRTATRESLQVVGDTWTRDIAPKHFTKQGEKEYGYQPRTRRYVFRKIREYKRGTGKRRAIEPATPLVYSGRSRKAALETKFRPIRDKDSKEQVARGTIKAPALNFRRSGNSPDMRAEVTAVSDADTKALAGVFQREYQTRFMKR